MLSLYLCSVSHRSLLENQKHFTVDRCLFDLKIVLEVEYWSNIKISQKLASLFCLAQLPTIASILESKTVSYEWPGKNK